MLTRPHGLYRRAGFQPASPDIRKASPLIQSLADETDKRIFISGAIIKRRAQAPHDENGLKNASCGCRVATCRDRNKHPIGYSTTQSLSSNLLLHFIAVLVNIKVAAIKLNPSCTFLKSGSDIILSRYYKLTFLINISVFPFD